MCEHENIKERYFVRGNMHKHVQESLCLDCNKIIVGLEESHNLILSEELPDGKKVYVCKDCFQRYLVDEEDEAEENQAQLTTINEMTKDDIKIAPLKTLEEE